MKQVLKVISTIGIALSLAACSSSITPANQTSESQPSKTTQTGSRNFTKDSPAVIRFAHQMLANSPLDKSIQKFKEIVESKSEGRIKVENYPAGQLYSEKEIPTQVTKGSIEMGLATSSLWGSLSPTAQIFDIPYQFGDMEQVHKAIDGEIGKSISKNLETIGAKPVFYPDYGFLHMTTSKDPTGDGSKPEDYKGLKVRVPGKMAGVAVQAMESAPVFMGGNEVYLALQKGTIDASTSGLTSILERKYYEVQDTLVLNNMTVVQFIASINTKFYDSLPADLQKVVNEAALEAQNYSRSIFEEEEKHALETLKKDMKVIEIKNLDHWKKLNEAAKKMYLEQTGDDGKKLLEEVGKVTQ